VFKLEIERKWLIDVNKIPYDLTKLNCITIEQNYVSFEPEIRVRKINDGENYVLTVKTNLTDDGLKRDEYEIDITEEEYINLLGKREGVTIYKNRYKIIESGRTLEIDIYQKELEGLLCLEIEFKTEEEAKSYIAPDWIEYEVTSDRRYKNSYLVRYGIPN